MTRIVLTAQVEDTAAWEPKFRSHADMFRKFGVADTYEYSIGENSEVAVCVDVSDADAFLEILSSPENVAAMENDGVNRDSVKIFVVDKALRL